MASAAAASAPGAGAGPSTPDELLSMLNGGCVPACVDGWMGGRVRRPMLCTLTDAPTNTDTNTIDRRPSMNE